MVRIELPSKMITGKARGKEDRTPNMAPLLIDKALPKANTLNSKRFERLRIKILWQNYQTQLHSQMKILLQLKQ